MNIGSVSILLLLTFLLQTAAPVMAQSLWQTLKQSVKNKINNTISPQTNPNGYPPPAVNGYNNYPQSQPNSYQQPAQSQSNSSAATPQVVPNQGMTASARPSPTGDYVKDRMAMDNYNLAQLPPKDRGDPSNFLYNPMGGVPDYYARNNAFLQECVQHNLISQAEYQQWTQENNWRIQMLQHPNAQNARLNPAWQARFETQSSNPPVHWWVVRWGPPGTAYEWNHVLDEHDENGGGVNPLNPRGN